MKTKGRRQSKNVEVQTDKEARIAKKGLELQDKALNNDVLREPTPIRKQKNNEGDDILASISNPASINSRMANNPKMAGRAIKSPAERRGLKDPEPKKIKKSSGGDFKFFTHKTKGK